MRYIALHYCSQFKKNLIAFGVSYGQKTAQKQPVQWFFAASKNLWKFITYQPQSYTNGTYHDYVPS